MPKSKRKPLLKLKAGDTVEYRTVKSDALPSHTGKVLDVLEMGIPSCTLAMVRIDGKSGYVLAAHCKVVSHEDSKP